MKHEFSVLAVECINRDLIVSGGDDCIIVVWEWEKPIKLRTAFAHCCSVTSLLLFGHQLVSTGGDGLLKMWEVEELAAMETKGRLEESCRVVQVSTHPIEHCCVYGESLLAVDSTNSLYLVRDTKASEVKWDVPYDEVVMGVLVGQQGIIVSIGLFDVQRP